MRPVRLSIFWKIFSTIIVSMGLSSLVVGLLYLGIARNARMHPFVRDALISNTRQLAATIMSATVAQQGTLAEIVQGVYAQEQVNLRVLGPDGSVLVNTVDPELRHSRTIAVQAVGAVPESGWKIKLLYPDWVLVPVVTVPLILDAGGVGTLQVYYPLIEGGKRLMPRGLPELISLSILAGLIVLLTRLLTSPLRQLTRLARAIAEGNFGMRVPIRSHDEVGQLADAVNHMSERLSALLNSRKELFADISHELRSPLARILTDAEIMIDKKMASAEREQHLRAICNDVDIMTRLIDDLAILAQTDQRQLQMAFVRASLSEVISQAASMFLLQIEEKQISLTTEFDDSVPPLMMDPKRIGQVISNLLMNALRYTPAGGTISAGFRRAEATVEVWVSDTGEGIPETKLPFIFERFYRVDKSRSRETGGSGLGLAIARQFVQAHGGRIWATSSVGAGTRIVFTLPLA